MTKTEIERLAIVENEVRHLNDKHDEFRDEVRAEFKSMKSDVAAIKTLLEQEKGGWSVAVFAVGGFAGFVAFLNIIWDWIIALLPTLPR